MYFGFQNSPESRGANPDPLQNKEFAYCNITCFVFAALVKLFKSQSDL